MNKPPRSFLSTTLILLLLNGCCLNFSCLCQPSVWIKSEDNLISVSAEISDLHVNTHNGEISIAADATLSDIQVNINMEAGGTDTIDAEECLKAIEIIADTKDGVFNLGWKYRVERKRNWGARVNFDILLPPSISIDATSHNGDIKVEGMNSPLFLMSHNGKIKIFEQQNSVDATTHNGRIDIKATTSNVKLRTHNGDISAVLDQVPVLDGNIVTHNGSVSITVNGEPSTRLSCHTSNGSLTLDKALHKSRMKRNKLSGSIGEGDLGALNVETHNGSITIR